MNLQCPNLCDSEVSVLGRFDNTPQDIANGFPPHGVHAECNGCSAFWDDYPLVAVEPSRWVIAWNIQRQQWFAECEVHGGAEWIWFNDAAEIGQWLLGYLYQGDEA